MNQARIDGILRANEDRISLFVSDCVMVYGSDTGMVGQTYEAGQPINGGARYPYASLTAICHVLDRAGFPVTVIEDRN